MVNAGMIIKPCRRGIRINQSLAWIWHWRDFGSQHPVMALCWMMKNMKIPTHQLGNLPSLLRSSLPWLEFPQGFGPLYNDGWFFGMVLLFGLSFICRFEKVKTSNRDQLISCCKFFDEMTTEWNTSSPKKQFLLDRHVLVLLGVKHNFVCQHSQQYVALPAFCITMYSVLN